ncbi:MAG: Rab family GTPase [Oligoflexales bacterium]
MTKFLLFLGLILFCTRAKAISELRITMLGDSAVGKTALLEQLRGRKFDEKLIFSMGIDFATTKAVINLEDVRFITYDTWGIPYYRDSISITIKNNLDGALIVFDLTEPSSLENIDVWIDIIRTISKKTPIVLIGNKADNKKSRLVDRKIAERFARSYGLKYYETSAKNGPGLVEPLAYLAKKLDKRTKSVPSLSLPISRDEEIYFKDIEANPIEMLMYLLDNKNNPHKFETNLSDYFFQDQLSHQHLISNIMENKLENYTAFCLKNISKIRKLEHKMSKINHYRIFSFIVSLGINLSFESKELFDLLYENLQKDDLKYLSKILLQWDELIGTEFKKKIYLMEYLKVENDFQLLLSSVRKISYEILNCSRWGDELNVEEQELLMTLENLTTTSLQRIVGKLRNSPDGKEIVQDILNHSPGLIQIRFFPIFH